MERIDGETLKRMIINASAAVHRDRQEINELNVFPVPDGDTGTNMSMTLGAASNELLNTKHTTVGDIAETAAKAMVRGARGNSGVILSLLFRGFSKVLKGLEYMDAPTYAAALTEGVSSAYKAVMKPTEGTILTVSRVCAASASESAKVGNTLDIVISDSLSAAKAALEDTVRQNPVLEKAGVIDSGGKGFVVLLEAMLSAYRGEEPVAAAPAQASKPAADFSQFTEEDVTFTYCTEFIVNVAKDSYISPEKLRAYLGSLGDSLVFVEDDDIIKVHVHTNDPGKALQESLGYGYLTSIKIENMRVQHTEKVIMTGMAPVVPGERNIVPPEKRYGIVSVCVGDGLTAVFKDLGVDVVVEGGQTMNPSTEDILSAIDRTPAEVVFVFPNNGNIIMTAEQCIPMSDKTVIVMPTRSVPQGISALLAFDTEASIDQNRSAMLDAASHVRTGQVTGASRDSTFDGKRIKEGDRLALLDGRIVANGKTDIAVCRKLARELSRKPTEFINIFYGKKVTEAEVASIKAVFEKELKESEINVVYGGQPVYYYLISAE